MSNTYKPLNLKILIGCEESQVLCSTFRKHNYNAYSCDIIPTRGNPEYHYQEDIFECINKFKWDLIILHPPCTALCLSGNRWYGKGKLKNYARQEAIKWTLDLWKHAKNNCNHVALENPASVIFKYLHDVQMIQPWQFGDAVNKQTYFSLYNLPRLKSTNIVKNPQDTIHKMAPSKTRSRDRATTFQGIADAIVDQWGNYIKELNNVKYI